MLLRASTLPPLRWVRNRPGGTAVGFNMDGGSLAIEPALEREVLRSRARLRARSWYAKVPDEREPVDETESERSIAI